MKNKVQSGRVLTLVAPYTVASGAGALVGKRFAVACTDITSGAKGEFDTEGVFNLAKDTSTFADGDPVYWDNANKVCISTFQSNWLIGVAAMTVLDSLSAPGGGSGDATVRVKLNSGPVRAMFKSSEQTGTGSAQNIAHGFSVTPSLVHLYPSDTSVSTAGVYVLTEGSHTSTNIVATVTTNKKFFAVAFA